MIETLHTYYWMYNLSKGKVKSHWHCKINFTQVPSTRHPCPSLPTQLISPRQMGHSSPESHRYSLMTELHWWPCRNWCRKSRGHTPCRGCSAVDSSDGECMLPTQRAWQVRNKWWQHGTAYKYCWKISISICLILNQESRDTYLLQKICITKLPFSDRQSPRRISWYCWWPPWCLEKIHNINVFHEQKSIQDMFNNKSPPPYYVCRGMALNAIYFIGIAILYTHTRARVCI